MNDGGMDGRSGVSSDTFLTWHTIRAFSLKGDAEGMKKSNFTICLTRWQDAEIRDA